MLYLVCDRRILFHSTCDNLRKQKNISDEKTQFFINTAHDIRTPLTLIKAPLEELLEEENLTDNGITRTNIALRNVEVLLRLGQQSD